MAVGPNLKFQHDNNYSAKQLEFIIFIQTLAISQGSGNRYDMLSNQYDRQSNISFQLRKHTI